MSKSRIVTIDVLKVIAVFVVMNSHMEVCYGKYEILATGGAIGDALFFFCSGFTILMGGDKSFPNYYKRRISRIYPTIMVIALLASLIYDKYGDMWQNVVLGGGWFVSCIMLYYIPLYFVHRYFMDRFNWVWITTALVILISYYLLFKEDWNGSIFMHGDTKFKWVFNFIFMLYGGYVGRHHSNYKYSWKSIPLLVLSVLIWYSFFFLSKNMLFIADFQYLSIIPLFGVVHYLYVLCNSPFFTKLAMGKVSGQVIFIIGGLCLESYLIQSYLFTDRLNWLFPINIPIIMLFILMAAYIVNMLSNIVSQTFKSEDYNYSKWFLHKEI